MGPQSTDFRTAQGCVRVMYWSALYSLGQPFGGGLKHTLTCMAGGPPLVLDTPVVVSTHEPLPPDPPPLAADAPPCPPAPPLAPSVSTTTSPPHPAATPSGAPSAASPATWSRRRRSARR